MKSLEHILENHPEIDDQLRAFYDTEFKIKSHGLGVEIFVPGASSMLRLDRKQLESIEGGDLLNDVHRLKYQQDCGISFDTYSEFFITINHPRYFFLDLHSDWPGTIPLKFKVGSIFVVVGDASPLIVLLMESAYRDSDIHPDGFSSFATVKLLGADHKIAESSFHKALYYLNSHYLKPVGLVACLRHLETGFDDPLGLYYGTSEPEEVFKKIIRSRIRQRNDFVNTEPLVLYNHACNSSGIESFLSFYRVLEFFFTRGILARIEALRHDPSASAQDILDSAIFRNEEQQLQNLVKKVLTASQKKKLFEYARSHSLISDNKIRDVVSGLYAFRNSLVHAKEKQLHKATLLDPFEKNPNIQKWTYIVAVCAERAIRQLNESKEKAPTSGSTRRREARVA